MASVTASRVASQTKLAAWLPLAGLPVAAVLLASRWPAWLFMWTLAFSIYMGVKWLSFATSSAISNSTLGRSVGYLLFWPGMDARSFLLSSRPVESPRWHEWLLAGVKTALGVLLVVVAAFCVNRFPMLAGWIGIVGIAFILHFGLFHLLSVGWRTAGIDARPIMDSPCLAASLSDFWGRRWNLAFRDLSHTFVFQPLVGRIGIAGATMAVFLASGVVHDAVISVPARAGYGLPTLYFAIQGVGVLFERSRLGRRIGTRQGVIGRLFCATVTLGPIALPFHQPFVERVIVPMLLAIGSFEV